ncbi:MAG: amidase [Chloroflexi bacterium]|nr:amidase [Chloroflexota bacterium]
MTEPFHLTVAEASSRIRARTLSPVELMESLLARSQALDPELRVWVTLDPDAASAEAHESQRALEKNGPAGPLHGVPVGVKDIFYAKGVRNTAGSPIYADFVPDYDSTPVKLLRRAGAIVMGKTVTTQFALGDPPPTRNPWNSAHTPGGSSSGSAVGVSARMFPAALGSQTAGSVIRPASFSGVVGFKPTFGRVSRYGVVPVSWSLDTVGCFTRTVEDATLMLGAMAGHDPNDVASADNAVPDYLESLGSGGRPPRIGLVRWFFLDTCDDQAKQVTLGVVEKLSRAGADVEGAHLDFDYEVLLAAHQTIMAAEAAAVHRRDFEERPDDYAPFIRGVIEKGFLIPATTYIKAQRIRRDFRRQVARAMDGFDILLTTSTDSEAPRDLTATGNPFYQVPWTMTGLPVISLPCGLGAAGLPLGVQLLGRAFDERGLLTTARWCEEALDVSLYPAGIG